MYEHFAKDESLKELCEIFLGVDNHFFWHGQETFNGRPFSGEENAAKIASQLGGQTLEMILSNNKDYFEGLGIRYKDTERINGQRFNAPKLEEDGRLLSMLFALSAHGEIVHVVGGNDKRKSMGREIEEHLHPGIFRTIELPLMMLAEKVTTIKKVSPVDGRDLGVVTLAQEFERMHGQRSAGEVFREYVDTDRERAVAQRIKVQYDELREVAADPTSPSPPRNNQNSDRNFGL